METSGVTDSKSVSQWQLTAATPKHVKSEEDSVVEIENPLMEQILVTAAKPNSSHKMFLPVQLP
jgi:hypothetical protein